MFRDINRSGEIESLHTDMERYRDIQRYREIYKDIDRYRELQRDTERYRQI